MRRAAPALGQAAQAVGGVVFFIALACGWLGCRVEQQLAVFGDEEEEQAINQTQELAVILLGVQGAGTELVCAALYCPGRTGNRGRIRRSLSRRRRGAGRGARVPCPGLPSTISRASIRPARSASTRDWWHKSQSSAKSA